MEDYDGRTMEDQASSKLPKDKLDAKCSFAYGQAPKERKLGCFRLYVQLFFVNIELDEHGMTLKTCSP